MIFFLYVHNSIDVNDDDEEVLGVFGLQNSLHFACQGQCGSRFRSRVYSVCGSVHVENTTVERNCQNKKHDLGI